MIILFATFVMRFTEACIYQAILIYIKHDVMIEFINLKKQRAAGIAQVKKIVTSLSKCQIQESSLTHITVE